MKRFRFSSVALLMIPLLCFAQQRDFPINNGKLYSPLNANHQPITNVTALAFTDHTFFTTAAVTQHVNTVSNNVDSLSNRVDLVVSRTNDWNAAATHTNRTDNPHETTAAQVGAATTLQGTYADGWHAVSNSVQTSASAMTTIISRTNDWNAAAAHTNRTDNPHSTTPSQIGAATTLQGVYADGWHAVSNAVQAGASAGGTAVQPAELANYVPRAGGTIDANAEYQWAGGYTFLGSDTVNSRTLRLYDDGDPVFSKWSIYSDGDINGIAFGSPAFTWYMPVPHIGNRTVASVEDTTNWVLQATNSLWIATTNAITNAFNNVPSDFLPLAGGIMDAPAGINWPQDDSTSLNANDVYLPPRVHFIAGGLLPRWNMYHDEQNSLIWSNGTGSWVMDRADRHREGEVRWFASEEYVTNATCVATNSLWISTTNAITNAVNAIPQYTLPAYVVTNRWGVELDLATNLVVAGFISATNGISFGDRGGVTPTWLNGVYRNGNETVIKAQDGNIRVNEYGQLIVGGQGVFSGSGTLADQYASYNSYGGYGYGNWASVVGLGGPTYTIRSNLVVSQHAVIASNLTVAGNLRVTNTITAHTYECDTTRTYTKPTVGMWYDKDNYNTLSLCSAGGVIRLNEYGQLTAPGQVIANADIGFVGQTWARYGDAGQARWLNAWELTIQSNLVVRSNLTVLGAANLTTNVYCNGPLYVTNATYFGQNQYGRLLGSGDTTTIGSIGGGGMMIAKDGGWSEMYSVASYLALFGGVYDAGVNCYIAFKPAGTEYGRWGHLGGLSIGKNILDNTLTNGCVKIQSSLQVMGDYVGPTNRYEDLRINVQGMNIAGAPGAAVVVVDSGPSSDQIALQFAAAGTTVAGGDFQLPHDWITNTTVYPHLHMHHNTTAIGTSVWQIVYSWGNIGAAFPASTTVTVTNKQTANLQWVQQFVNIPTNGISGVGKDNSSVLRWRVSRMGDDAADNYSGAIDVVSADLHYMVRGSPLPIPAIYTP